MSRVYKQQPGPTDNKAEVPAKETKRTRTTKPVEKDEPKEDSDDGEKPSLPHLGGPYACRERIDYP